MDSSKAAILAVLTLLGLLVLAQGEGARASAISLRRPAPTATAAASEDPGAEVRCTPVRHERPKVPESKPEPTQP
jgi:hypothetical protein